MTGIQHENGNGQPQAAASAPQEEARQPSFLVYLVAVPMGIAGGLFCSGLAGGAGVAAAIAAGTVGGTVSGIIGSILGGLLTSVVSRKG